MSTKQKRRARQQRKSHQARKPERVPILAIVSDDQVLTFGQWAALNGLSPRTGRRVIAEPGGPAIIKLSENRIGISVRANREWQASRTRNPQTM
jgi:hypothetical protein